MQPPISLVFRMQYFILNKCSFEKLLGVKFHIIHFIHVLSAVCVDMQCTMKTFIELDHCFIFTIYE